MIMGENSGKSRFLNQVQSQNLNGHPVFHNIAIDFHGLAIRNEEQLVNCITTAFNKSIQNSPNEIFRKLLSTGSDILQRLKISSVAGEIGLGGPSHKEKGANLRAVFETIVEEMEGINIPVLLSVDEANELKTLANADPDVRTYEIISNEKWGM